jgi:hypothetical protein
MYVSPFSEVSMTVDEEELERQGLIGGYREKVGWDRENAGFKAQVYVRIGIKTRTQTDRWGEKPNENHTKPF